MTDKTVKEIEERSRGKISRLFYDLPVSLLIAGNIFLFIPFAIYQGNLEEFSVSLAPMLKIYFLPALLLIAVLQGIGMLLGEKNYKRYTSFLFILGILI